MRHSQPPESNVSPTLQPSIRASAISSDERDIDLLGNAETSLEGYEASMPYIATTKETTGDLGFLLKPEMYHNMTNDDIPQAFRITHQRREPNCNINDLLSSGCFREAAQIAANALQASTDPHDYSAIYSLFYARLVCLSLLDYQYEAAQEAKALQDFNSPYFRDSKTGLHRAPWELRLLVFRLQGVEIGDWRRSIINYYDLAREARWHLLSASDTTQKLLWRQRLEDLALQIGHALIEMDDLDGAARHLETLANDRIKNTVLLVKLALVHLRIGDISAAKHHLYMSCEPDASSSSVASLMIDALCAMAEGQFNVSVELWSSIASDANGPQGIKTMAEQNKAVCLVYAGKILEARELLEGLVQDDNVPHGITFNLATIFELSSENARSLKIALTHKIASHEVSCISWEKFNADFKL